MLDATESYEYQVYNLIFNKRFRTDFIDNIAKRSSNDDFSVVNIKQLKSLSSKVCHDILNGHLKSGLLHSFPKSIEYIKKYLHVNETELAHKFMESFHFYECRTVPNISRGLCVEEAFYKFLIQAEFKDDINLRDYSKHEFFSFIFKLIKKSNYKIDLSEYADIRMKNNCIWSVVNYDVHSNLCEIFKIPIQYKTIQSSIAVIYGSTNRGYISGVISGKMETWINYYENNLSSSNEEIEQFLLKLGFYD